MKMTVWSKLETEEHRLVWLGNPLSQPIPQQYWIPKGVTTRFEKEVVMGMPYQKTEMEVEDWWWEQYGPESAHAKRGRPVWNLEAEVENRRQRNE